MGCGEGFRKTSFLGRVGPDDRQALEAVGRRCQVRANETLFVEGDGSGRVLLLLQGHAKVFSTSPRGRTVLYGVRGPGEIAGELSAIDGEPRIATAITLDAVELVAVSAPVFHSMLRERPGIAYALLLVLADRLRESDRFRTRFGTDDSVGRLAALLVDLAGEFGCPDEANGNRPAGGVRIDLPLTQQDLADWVGASREAVTKALHGFRTAGLVETDRRRIVVLDPDALLHRAG